MRNLIATSAGVTSAVSTLSDSIEDLFETFFPDKKYEGPRSNPDGTLSFPIVLSDGSTHDINELSSGEKEIVYGYLRLRDADLRNSMILF